jgi:hypothetical protein
MADTTGYITFTDVGLSGPGGTGLFNDATLFIDYTTGSVVVVVGGNLTFTTPSSQTFSFSGPEMHVTQVPPDSGNYVLTAGSFISPTSFPALALDWSGTAPTALSGGAVQTAAGPGHLWSGTPPSPNSVSAAPPCFAAGTLIRTPGGDVPVETLTAGDLVVTATGDMRPIKWIGHRDFDCRQHPDPAAVHPVRVATDAFGPNRPSHDLLLSDAHAVCMDLCGEVLIPVGCLINGATIARVEVDRVSYWHVELDSHDILIANNLLAESYMEMSNRAFFEEAGAGRDTFVRGNGKTYEDFCRPVVTEGRILEFARERLMARAKAIGWMGDCDADLHLLVDGEVRRPLAEGDAAVFLFADSAHDVRLVSNTFVPARVGQADRRELGVCVYGLAFVGSGGEARRVSLDDARLGEGLHGEEASSGAYWRWTKGELVLDPQFWAGLTGPIAFYVNHNAQATRQWIPPARPPEVVPVQSKSKQRLYSIR